MLFLKCKMCGGDLEVNEKMTVGICSSCGTQQTLPRISGERRANLYDRANHFRRAGEFDKAEAVYEQILSEDTTDAEAYWSLVLCEYGVEYVEDPKTHNMVPTCSRTQYTSIYANENYKRSLEYADASAKIIYQAQASLIDEIQKGILAVSANEPPFDVFICYKETDENGKRTPDSVLAQDLYYQLTQEGFRVFFARITLEEKLGSAYEPYIFAALNSSKVMVVIGTKPEHFNAPWVRNEWFRYLKLIKSGAKKTLIPAYKDMDAYDLPEEFSNLQAQDMSRLGFMQDLIRGIKKIIAAVPAATPGSFYQAPQHPAPVTIKPVSPPFTPYSKTVSKPPVTIPPKIKRKLPLIIGVSAVAFVVLISLSALIDSIRDARDSYNYLTRTEAYYFNTTYDGGYNDYTTKQITTRYEPGETNPPASFKISGKKATIPFENPTVSIESGASSDIPYGKGKIIVQLLGGGSPLTGKGIGVYTAVLNIAGQWAIEKSSYGEQTDESGFISSDFDPGNYAITLGNEEVFGTYGIIGKENNRDKQLIPVTVESGKAVVVTISLARLDVGVLSLDGKSAISGRGVCVYPQSADIAGNPIPMDGFGNEFIQSTAAGISVWYLGAGTYTAKCYDSSIKDFSYKYDIKITAGAKTEITFKIAD